MTVKPRFEGARPIAQPPRDTPFLEDVWNGLAASPKALPAKYFYDAAGSSLFERITTLPEYYPTRTELEILDTQGVAIAGTLPERAVLVEFGSGSSLKLRRLLSRRPDLAAYVPVDVSESYLAEQATRLGEDFPSLTIAPVVADFTEPFALPEPLSHGPHAGFFPGSTVGNFRPDEAEALLDRFGTILGPGAMLIVGVDLVKDRATLEAAYDDREGVTAAFNLNMIERINRELGGDLDIYAFDHRAIWNEAESRIEMHLVSRMTQDVHVAGRRFRFRTSESIHTENSYKYTIEGFRALAVRAGWAAIEAWTDPAGLFSVHALRRGTPL